MIFSIQEAKRNLQCHYLQKKTEILYYVTFDELFNMIHEAHIAVGHGGRTCMIKELNHRYKNVTVESIITYQRLCEPCQKKQKNSEKRNCS